MSSRASRGFTLIEIVVSLVILGVVAGTALVFLQGQTFAFTAGAARAETVQNLRYALQRLEIDLSTVGTHVPQSQPVIVYADESLIAFHADFATNLPDDPFAVYYTPGAPPGQVSTPTSPILLPGTAVSYPTTVYQVAPGIASPAELIVLFFQPDELSERDDEFVLVRQVNDGAPDVVARGLRRIGQEPFFRYVRVRTQQGVGPVLDSVPAASLPVVHPDAGGGTLLADSIRGLRVQIAAGVPANGRETPELRVTRTIRFPNAERTGSDLPLCGNQPILGVPLTAELIGTGQGGSGPYEVQLSWSPAVDEAGGERDVIRYVIWRKAGFAASWGDPYRNIPSGSGSYSWRDVDVAEGSTYQYALAAQDCTPAFSETVVSGTITIPVTP